MFTDNKKVQVVLASYFQSENHGPGRKISISPSKPKEIDYDCDFIFEALSPGQLYWDYMKNKREATAGDVFVSGFQSQLNDFKQEVLDEVKTSGKSVFEVLPFENGDTLLSWENKGNMSYRRMVCECLTELGYEVIEN